jgi:Tannase and feruloyl esterase
MPAVTATLPLAALKVIDFTRARSCPPRCCSSAWLALAASIVLATVWGGVAAAGKPCATQAFARQRFGNSAVRSADRDPSGSCRVRALTSSGKGSIINFEVWIPDGWNGKVVVTGNAGYSNVPNYRDMTHALSQGYAAVGGDTGHQTLTPDDLLWGVGHPERILDWGTRSIHTIVEPAKRLVRAVTGKSPKRAYYYGCSTGGHQAYAEIQRYPETSTG